MTALETQDLIKLLEASTHTTEIGGSGNKEPKEDMERGAAGRRQVPQRVLIAPQLIPGLAKPQASMSLVCRRNWWHT